MKVSMAAGGSQGKKPGKERANKLERGSARNNATSGAYNQSIKKRGGSWRPYVTKC